MTKWPIMERTADTYELIDEYFLQSSARVRSGSTRQSLKYSTVVPDERFGVTSAALAGIDPAQLTDADRLKALAEDERGKPTLAARNHAKQTGKVLKPTLTGIKPDKAWFDAFFGKKNRYAEAIPMNLRAQREL